MVEEDVVVIRISPTTTGMVFTSKRFIGISAVPIGMSFRAIVNHMLDANAAVKGLVEDAVMTAHTGDVAVANYNIFQILILFGLTQYLEDVSAEESVHIMALDLEKDFIHSHVMSHRPYAEYLNNNNEMPVR